MRKWLLGFSSLVFGLVLVATDADAGRLGGGRSVGAQRSVTAPPAATPAKPAQQAAPQGQSAPQAAPAQPSRWGMFGGILGGLALGGLLGYLFGGNGLAGLLLLGALAIIAVMALRALLARRAEQARPVQLAGMNETLNEHGGVPPQQPAGAALTRVAAVPAGFDTAGFLKAAKTNFLKLQMAHDAGRVDEIREFTTPEMFEALRGHFEAGQETDVASLDADLLELATEGAQHWASVRFSGSVREAAGAAPVGFSEVWNLVKPVDASSGWLLAGIQQMH
jgi:predicted lipid-binding transport protein (Tim44 family)